MEALTTKLDVQIKLLKFTQGKTKGIAEKGNSEGIERQHDALRAIVKKTENVKTQIEQAKLESGIQVDELAEWSAGVEEQQATADEEITHLLEKLAQVNFKTSLQAKESEEELTERARDKQLQFERAQLEQKLEFGNKMEEATKSHGGQIAASPAPVKSAKLPKLVITKFSGELTDWLRFCNQFEAEIDRSEVAGVTKCSYLKELVDPNGSLRKGMSEIVTAYIQNIMALPTITSSNPRKIHEFYEKLVFNVQSLETLGKLKEISGYVRMSIDKLQGIRGDLVGTDDNWRE